MQFSYGNWYLGAGLLRPNQLMNQGIGHMYVNSKLQNFIIIAVNYAYDHPEDFQLIPSIIVYISSFCSSVIAILHYSLYLSFAL